MGSPSPPPPPPPPKWVILRRDPQVCRDLSDDFSLTLGKPPNLTELAVSRHLAPDGVSVDCFPLIHAADPSGILLVSATYGRRSMGPPSADDDDKQAGNHTTNYFVWNAATDDTHRLPPHAESVKHTGNVGLVVAPRGDDEYNFMVAELLPPAGDRATLLCYWSYGREWVKKMVPFPLNLKFPWSGARTFSYQGKLWWLDLWQGLLNCDPFAKEPELLFVPLPDDTHTDTGDRDVSNHRCVNLSNGGLWLAEMTYHRRVLFVKMWKLGAQGQWTPDYTVKLADIWVDRSYEETGLPKKKPALVGINPDDPEVLYFLLGGNLLQVNMCAKRVELCVDFSPTTNLKIGQGSSQSQFILTWNLPTSIVSSSGQNQEERSSRDSAFDTIVDSFTNACASVPDHMEFSQLAMTAIEYLNQSRKEEKVKFRLSECLCLCYFDEEEASTSHRKQYIHMNFYVRTESERLPQLVFAEFVEANRNDDELCSWDLLSCKSINKNSPGGLYNTNADVGQKRKRSLHCYACEGQMKHPSSGFSAGCRADASKLVTDAEPLGAEPARESETEEGSAYDAGAEFTGLQLLHLTPDEQISRWRRLYKKRANMSLVFYHKSHSDRYEFAHVCLNDIFDFIEGKVAYLHMNFKARNVTTGSEQIFFSELMAEMDSNDDASNGYYRVSACEIVDGNCSGGRKQEVDCKYIPGNKHDMDNCYVCAEKIKHPVGSTYKGGHSVSDYGVEEISTE